MCLFTVKAQRRFLLKQSEATESIHEMITDKLDTLKVRYTYTVLHLLYTVHVYSTVLHLLYTVHVYSTVLHLLYTVHVL